METCKEFRVEWESVVSFGMKENVGEERVEKEERAEGGGCGSWCGVVVVLCCVVCCVLCCVVVWWCVCCATKFYQGCVHNPCSFRSSLQNVAGEQLAHHVVSNDSGKYWQIDTSLLIQWIVVHDCSSLVESCVWLLPFCVYREKEERTREERKKKEREREKSRLIAG